MNESSKQTDVQGGPPPDDMVLVPKVELDALKKLAEATTAAEAALVAASGTSSGAPDPARRRPDEALRREEPHAEEEASRVARELASRERRLGELEKALLGAVRDRELATTLAGKPLVTGAAGQLVKLWRDEFEAYEDGGVYKVAGKDGRPISQVVGEWLSHPEFAHFCLPSSRGGAGVKDAHRPSAAPSATAPKNLGEAVVRKWQEESAARLSPFVKPIGLRRTR
jgi:hypothetical protein